MLADPSLDLRELCHAIREEYEAVALEPSRGFHVHTHRPLAQTPCYSDGWNERGV